MKTVRRFVRSLSLLGIILMVTGCSLPLIRRGMSRNITSHRYSREQIHRTLGEPNQQGALPSGIDGAPPLEYEIYVVRGPLYPKCEDWGYKMMTVMTLGLAELYCFPKYCAKQFAGHFDPYTFVVLYQADGVQAGQVIKRAGRHEAACFANELHRAGEPTTATTMLQQTRP